MESLLLCFVFAGSLCEQCTTLAPRQGAKTEPPTSPAATSPTLPPTPQSVLQVLPPTPLPSDDSQPSFPPSVVRHDLEVETLTTPVDHFQLEIAAPTPIPSPKEEAHSILASALQPTSNPNAELEEFLDKLIIPPTEADVHAELISLLSGQPCPAQVPSTSMADLLPALVTSSTLPSLSSQNHTMPSSYLATSAPMTNMAAGPAVSFAGNAAAATLNQVASSLAAQLAAPKPVISQPVPIVDTGSDQGQRA